MEGRDTRGLESVSEGVVLKERDVEEKEVGLGGVKKREDKKGEERGVFEKVSDVVRET